MHFSTNFLFKPSRSIKYIRFSNAVSPAPERGVGPDGRRGIGRRFFLCYNWQVQTRKGEPAMAKDKDKGKEKGNKPKLSIKDKKKKKKEKLEKKASGL
jgi:hypothetical protein